MSSSFWSMDRYTHVTIVVVSLMAASVVVAVGMNARGDFAHVTADARAHGLVLKASKATACVVNDAALID